ncbi:MAG: hypothetical protein LBC84_04075 [Prevotellaceae bacterium]|nr:hypothetical protein [Prevotellaceae bacterium]
MFTSVVIWNASPVTGCTTTIDKVRLSLPALGPSSGPKLGWKLSIFPDSFAVPSLIIGLGRLFLFVIEHVQSIKQKLRLNTHLSKD